MSEAGGGRPLATGPISIGRRRALMGLAGSAVGVTMASGATPAAAQDGPGSGGGLDDGSLCVLTPQAVEGPFYLDPRLDRYDIAEGRPGAPLAIALQVVDVAGCVPVVAARVDIWHADAAGAYSGYGHQGDDETLSTVGQTFMRGFRTTDAAGRVGFRTVYPGWYRGRTPHVHIKVQVDQKTLLTGQMYFPDALTEFLYRNVAPYNARTLGRDTVNATDGVLKDSGGGHASFCAIKEEADHYLATLRIGITRSGGGAAHAGPPGGPPPGGVSGGLFGGLWRGGPPKPVRLDGALVPGVARPD